MINYKFRKKPAVVEAFQMTKERRQDNSEWPEWLHEAWNKNPKDAGAVYPREIGTSNGPLRIVTLEGDIDVSWNDYIICGTKGELYPCKPDIFESIYEEVE